MSFNCSSGEGMLLVSVRSRRVFRTPIDCSSELFWVRK